MPSKKKKYNARFPAGRIKKIMQTDEEVGKVAQAVPVIISRTLELFVESLIKKSMQITLMKNARTLSPHHMKLCILSESRFDFLRDLVKSVPEVPSSDDDLNSFSEVPSVSLRPKPERRTSKDSLSQPSSAETSGKASFPCFYQERESSVSEEPSIPSPGVCLPPESAKIDSNKVCENNKNNQTQETSAKNANCADKASSNMAQSSSEEEDEDDYDT